MILSYSITYKNFDSTQVSGGSFSVDVFTYAPDITVVWVNPSYPNQTLAPYEYNYYVTGLTAGTYTLQIIDSSNDTTGVFSIFLSSGCCTSIVDVQPTTCGNNNGSLTVELSQGLGLQIFDLYNISNTLINSISGNSIYATFNNLSSGIYYVIGNDGAGGTGRSESCIVQESSPFDFELYTVNTSSCNDDIGKIYVTNLTGTNPFTYVWSNGVTGQDYITGLTAGSYSLTITDGYGCSVTRSTLVTSADTMGIVSIVTDQPSCFASDGEITITISGGTEPYYFSGSNGYSELSFLPTFTFSGLGSGTLFISVTDAGWCQLFGSSTLFTPNSFFVNTITPNNSNCSINDGSITISTNGSGYPLQYTLINSLSQVVFVGNGSSSNYIIQNLLSDTYTLQITDNGNVCQYSTNVTISNNSLFDLTLTQTGTTCGSSNGYINAQITENGSIPPYYYQLISSNNSTISFVGGTDYTFSNLISDIYTVIVTDSGGCSQQSQITVDASSNCDFILLPNPSPFANSSSIDVFITNGTPPFILYWSSNVNGQSGTTVTNLSAGTYYVTVIDSQGCTRTRETFIGVLNSYSSYQTSIVCQSDGFIQNTLTTRGILQMFFGGYAQITESTSGCVFNSATFTSEVTVSGITYTDTFYTTSSLDDIPTDLLWVESIETLLESIYGIGDVTYNLVSNTITIPTDCNLPANLLAGADVNINLVIGYNLNCDSGPDCCGIITEDDNVPPEGPNYCIITEDDNGNENLIIETD
jgi:hypothetical protein